MKLPEVCIKHPVFATVLSLVLMVIGLVSYQRLELRFFPELTQPIVYVSVYYEGASQQTMETSVTKQIENALAGVDNIEAIYSGSANAWSRFTILFRPGGNFQEEANEVRNKIYGIRDQLPTDVHPPTVTVGGSGQELLHVTFIDPNKTAGQIRDFIERNVSPLIRQIEGVGSVGIHGASEYAMRIWLNSAAMAALNVTVTDVKTALETNNISFPAGAIQNPWRNYSIISRTQLKTVKDFADIIIKQENNRIIRFKDIATVKLGNLSLQDAPMRINSKPGIDVDIRPLRTANPIAVANKVKKELKTIKTNLPESMQMNISYDASLFLNSSIHETLIAIGESILLVILVVLAFLGSLRAAIIPIVTIPVCMIAVFSVMLLFGFTINTITLLAMVLAIGLVVDDAIVVLENIHRHIEEGLHPLQAALLGSKEIALPVIAMTLTLAAVYAPIGFAQGFTAEIFKEFAFTLAGAVIISGFTALTLSPMMCSELLQAKTHDTKAVHFIDHIFGKISTFYQKTLQTVLLKRVIIILVLLGIAVFGFIVFKTLASEFLPKEDMGLIQTSISTPSGSNLNYTNKYTKLVEQLFAQTPEANNYYANVGSGSATLAMTLKPWQQRKRTSMQIVKELSPKVARIPGIEASISVPDPVAYGLGGHDISFNIMTTGSYADLRKPTEQFMQILRQYPGLQHVDTNLKYDSQQYALTINRNLAAITNVNLQDIANTVQAMLGGQHITDVQAGTRSYPVMVQMQKSDLKNFIGFKKLYVRNANNKMIPLASLVKLTPVIGTPTLSHFNRMRNSIIMANLAPGYTESQAINYILSLTPKILGPGFHHAFDGKARDFLASQGGITTIFILSFIFIYLILSAQFGSFIDPFIILLAVPLCIVGALFTLKISGGTLNVYSQIGLVTLVGMITKHGILITQFANNLRAQGMPLEKAIVKAATIRLRPILMTTSAMIFGSIPLAFSSGPGSVGRNQIGWVIIGGLFFGTFFSLIVVPIAYSYLGKLKKFHPINSEMYVTDKQQ